MTPLTPRAFSLRRLNPFNGLLQVLQTSSARALSDTGLRWEIQVLSDRPQGLWANIPFSGKRYYTFGYWGSDTGLRQVAINPLFNVKDMIISARQIIAHLETAVTQLPFAQADSHELWSTHRESGQPLALLNSAPLAEGLKILQKPCWKAMDDNSRDELQGSLLLSNLETLENSVTHCIRQARQTVCHRSPENDSSTSLLDTISLTSKLEFPELPVTQDCLKSNDIDLLTEYIKWKSPQLLQLAGLSPATREMLEAYAVQQPEKIERYWRLYPEIHNKTLLNSARVKAKICKSK
jgi:hypothetical protein